jgi:hypothetical protein
MYHSKKPGAGRFLQVSLLALLGYLILVIGGGMWWAPEWLKDFMGGVIAILIIAIVLYCFFGLYDHF